MIPERIKKILTSAAVASVIVALCILPYDLLASMTFLVTSGWVMLNFIAWTIILGAALRPKDSEPNVLGLAIGLLAKLILLGVGLVALLYFAPYTRSQLLAVVLGVSFVLLVAFLKALGSRVAAGTAVPDAVMKKDADTKVVGS